LLEPVSTNQSLPSGPAVIPSGRARPVGMANSEMAWVVGLIIPILLTRCSVNQRLPSGPAVIPSGSALAVGTAKSVTARVEGLTTAILLAVASVNQRLPSGPAIMLNGPAPGVGSSAMVESSCRDSIASTLGRRYRRAVAAGFRRRLHDRKIEVLCCLCVGCISCPLAVVLKGAGPQSTDRPRPDSSSRR